MSDLIERHAAIDILDDYQVMVENGEEKPYAWARLRMSELPSAQSEPPWIPVSERLPKDGTEVFVYLFDLPSPFIAWIEDTRWYTEDFEVERENEPIAWMPLPEAYKGDK